MEREPQVIELSQLSADEYLRRQANTLIGQVLLQQSMCVDYVEECQSEVTVDLASAIERARAGDEQAVDLVRANVSTDYFERAYKYGFVSEVQLQLDQDGRLMQHGQGLHDIHMNSLRYTKNEKLRNRAKIEALNSLRDQHCAKQGILQDYARVVFSHVHDDMSDAEADAVGFFTRTKSLSIQLLTQQTDGVFVMQSAFVAGRENAESDSFDKQSVAALAEAFGISYTGASSEDILARPLLIHKSLLPNGVLSMVERYDQSAGEVTGKAKFFGRDTEQHITSHEYLEKKEQNRRQTVAMQDEVEVVVQKLLAGSTKMTAVEATHKLSELNDALIKARIVYDDSIDAGVLGVQAAYYVEHARHYWHQGMHEHPDVAILQQKIARVGVSSSCPSGGKSADFVTAVMGLESTTESDDTIPEDCDFISKECPKCGQKNVKTSCRKGVYYGECGCKSS